MLDLESDLRRAIARREFEPFLQPIVNLSDGAVLGYEALLRWRHSSRGLLLPIDFLSAAEDSGMIEQIDWYLYEQVFRAIPSLDDKKTYVGINVSARHFRSPHLATALLDMIAAYRVPPWRVSRDAVARRSASNDRRHRGALCTRCSCVLLAEWTC